MPAKLTAELIEAFAGMYLSPRYDNPTPTPQFHREAWALYSSDYPQVECMAPREHAKTTALTFDYVLAEALFKVSDYIILISSTEDLAAEALSNVSEELRENEDLIRDFKIAGFDSDTKTDIIVRFTNGDRFRILCRGAEQRIRGRMWNGKRPNLIVADDMEDDEQVENADRRTKFRRWFFRAAKQALSKRGKIRIHGTVLHDDSLLSRLAKCPKCKEMTTHKGTGSCPRCGHSKVWKHLFYKAHEGFDDFSNILWPDQWNKARLSLRKQEFIEDGDAAGYSQEFLNDPLDHTDAYLKRDDFLEMSKDDYDTPKIICAAADFAVSKADRANRSSFSVGGKCLSNRLHFVDQRVGRWDPMEWMEEIFSIQEAWSPEVFWVEDGVIWKSVKPMIFREMEVRDIRINFEPIMPIKDKGTRGRSFQRRMRARQCRFDKNAEWYPGFEQELLRFTGVAAATLDDQFDSAALLSRGFDNFSQIEEEDLMDDDELEFLSHVPRKDQGRSAVTGY